MNRAKPEDYQSEIDSILESLSEVDDEEIQSTLLEQIEDLEVKKSIVSCSSCSLRNAGGCTLPVPFSGSRLEAGRGFSVIGLGEAPGAEEDAQGEPFVGASGKLLRKTLNAVGLQLDGLVNTVSCRPPSNRTPNVQEIRACKSNLKNQISRFSPWLTICFGAVSLQSVAPELRITRDHGVFFTSKFLKLCSSCKNPGNCFFEGVEEHCGCRQSLGIGIYHPSYVLRHSRINSPESKKIREDFVYDLKHAAMAVQCRELLGANVVAGIIEEAMDAAPYIPGNPAKTEEKKKLYLQRLEEMERDKSGYNYGLPKSCSCGPHCKCEIPF